MSTVAREQLVETITQRVLEALSEGNGSPTEACADCAGACASRCSDKARLIVDAGAQRLSHTGDGAAVDGGLARYIDHTLLRPETTAPEIDELCAEAREHGFASVCVNPFWVKRCAAQLRGSGVLVASVVGFPFGATPPEIKALEARRAVRDGAREIDMVLNIGALRSGDHDLVRTDIAKVADACHEAGAKLKVIIETAYLSDEEKVIASHLAKQARADFVKTSTGFGPGGATVHDVVLMRETVGPKIGVKASGGVRTREDLEQMIAAGATRIGASAGVAIVSGADSDAQY